MASSDLSESTIGEIYAEGLRYFMGEGRLNNALARLAADLETHEIDYMVIGAVALLAHGYPRFTGDIDLVMTLAGLEKFHAELVGLDNVPSFQGPRKRISAGDRLKDLADVQELIKLKGLGADFAEKLDPYVRSKFIELQSSIGSSNVNQE